METSKFITKSTDADIFKVTFEDGYKILPRQQIQLYGNQLYLHIPEYQKYYDNGYTIKEFHEYRDKWAVRKNLLNYSGFDALKTCVYRKEKNSSVLDLLPHEVKTCHFNSYIEDNCIVTEIEYDMYKNFRRDVKDIVFTEDGKFLFSHLGNKKFLEIVDMLKEDGFTKPILMQPMDFSYYPLDQSILLTIACILKVPTLPMKFLSRTVSKDIEEKFIGNAANIMQVNYDLDVDIDLTEALQPKKNSTYRFFIADFDNLILNDDDHSDYIHKICKDEIAEYVKQHDHEPSDSMQYAMLKGKNHIRGYISDEYHEFGLDLMFVDNYLTKDGIEILDKIYDQFSRKYKIEKFLFDWKIGFKMSSTYEEFKQSIIKSKYYKPIWKSTQSI